MDRAVTLSRALLRPLFRAALAALLVSLLCWTLVECAPGSTAERAAIAARAIAPGDAQLPSAARQEILAELAAVHGLGDGLFWRASGIARLQLGRSWRDQRPVSERILARPGLRTLGLSLGALLMALLLGMGAALASARRPESLRHRGMGLYAALALSLPMPWLAMVAIEALAYGHPFALFPAGGQASLAHLLLPLLVLASAPAAIVWRHGHHELLAQSASPWVIAARARGCDERSLWRRQILRAALPRLLALLPVLLAYLLAASVVVERVFAIEGAGELVARAASAGDAPVLIAFASLSAALIAALSSCVDVLAGRLDPRRQERA